LTSPFSKTPPEEVCAGVEAALDDDVCAAANSDRFTSTERAPVTVGWAPI